MKKNILKLWTACALLLLTAMTLTTATYAWFTANRKVETDKVTAKTGSANVTLEISRTPAPNFTPGTVQNEAGDTVNQVELIGGTGRLSPVSTADLTHFWTASGFDPAGHTTGFRLDAGGQNYYHDTVYLRAVGENLPEGTRLELYLDNEEPIVSPEDAPMLTAARLGLKIDGKPVILQLSDADSGPGATYLENAPLPKDSVLGYNAQSPDRPVEAKKGDHPTAPLSDYCYDLTGAKRTPLTLMEPDRVYQVEIYFYLEGCDPDCLEENVGLTDAYLGLAFFGLLGSEGV